jgi:hypothetical protein
MLLARTVATLQRLEKIVEGTIEDSGGCDHLVGICVCDWIDAIEGSRFVRGELALVLVEYLKELDSASRRAEKEDEKS